MARSCSLKFFLSPEWLGAFFLTSLPVAECSEVVSYTNYGLHITDFAASRILLLPNNSRPWSWRTTDSPTFRTGTAATTATAAVTRRRLKSYARNSGSMAGPLSRVKTLVFTGTQDLSRRRHESRKNNQRQQYHRANQTRQRAELGWGGRTAWRSRVSCECFVWCANARSRVRRVCVVQLSFSMCARMHDMFAARG